jgi:crossover junction endodeoxyribonuclease RuvC
MGKSVYLLGLDPGFANMGWAVLELGVSSEQAVACGVLRTEKSDKKRKVLASDDNLRRSREVAGELKKILDTWTITAICAESMSFPRNSSAAAKMAMCWGSIATFSLLRGLSLVQSSPQEIKKALCGRKDASKEDIAEAVRKRYVGVEKMLEPVTPSVREHAYDAFASIAASLDTSEVIRVLRSMVT